MLELIDEIVGNTAADKYEAFVRRLQMPAFDFFDHRPGVVWGRFPNDDAELIKKLVDGVSIGPGEYGVVDNEQHLERQVSRFDRE